MNPPQGGREKGAHLLFQPSCFCHELLGTNSERVLQLILRHSFLQDKHTNRCDVVEPAMIDEKVSAQNKSKPALGLT